MEMRKDDDDRSKTAVSFEQLLVLVGGTGRWQLMVMCLAALAVAQVPLHSLGSVFLAANVPHRCPLPRHVLDNDTHDTHYNNNDPQLKELLQLWIPRDNATGQWRQCERLTVAGRHDLPTESCSSWVFDSDDPRQTSVLQQWQLVCGRRWMRSTIQSSYMFGCLLGSLVSGALSDRYGRRLTICVSCVLFLLFNIGTSFTSSYWTFIAVRFLSALPRGGLYCCLFVLCVEIVEPKKRAAVGLLFNLPYALGVMLLPALAFLVRSWSMLQLTVSLLGTCLLLYWRVLPESPRWLVLHGRLHEALDELKRAAVYNKCRQPPDDAKLMQCLEMYRRTELLQLDSQQTQEMGTTANTSPSTSVTCALLKTCPDRLLEVRKLFGTRRMRVTSVVHFFNWFIVALIYYGVTLDAAKLSASPYVAMLLAGVFEVPAYICALLLVNWQGRRVSVLITHCLAAVCLLLVLVAPPVGHLDWLRMLLRMLGRFAATACYGIIYLYSSECFPTVLRNLGVGLCGTFEDVGSMLAPYVVDLLGALHWSVPSVVFGCGALVAAAVIWATPETTNRRLPDTVAHVQNNWQLETITTTTTSAKQAVEN